MTYAHITLNRVVRRNDANVTAADSIPVGAETKTLSGTSQATNMTGALGDIWVIAATGDCFVIFNSNPTALATGGTTHHLIPSGTTREFNCSAASEKCAVISPA
jgi:hypothetical protein